jgi:hypothetical protein
MNMFMFQIFAEAVKSGNYIRGRNPEKDRSLGRWRRKTTVNNRFFSVFRSTTGHTKKRNVHGLGQGRQSETLELSGQIQGAWSEVPGCPAPEPGATQPQPMVPNIPEPIN